MFPVGSDGITFSCVISCGVLSIWARSPWLSAMLFAAQMRLQHRITLSCDTE